METSYQSLSRCGRKVDNVRWSADHRIAVTTPEIVFVCTLRTQSTSSHKPSLVVSTVHAPQAVSKDAVVSQTTLMDHIDPAFIPSSQSHDYFKRSNWSPAGCNALGGCVLTSLTESGSLMLHTPPPCSRGKVWTHASTLTNCLKDIPLSSSCSRMLFTKCTAFDWLPNTLNESGLVAMTTRSGHLVLVEVPLPINGSCDDVRVVWAGGLHDNPTGDVWGCTVKWIHSNSQTLHLAIGCTDGQVLSAQWSSADTTDLNDPTIASLWTNDSMPVSHVTTLTNQIVFSKGAALVVCSLEPKESPSDERASPLVICGHHSMPISGLGSLGGSGLISSALDGSLQMWVWPDNKPRSLQTGVTLSGPMAIHGLATSHNGLMAAFTVSERMNQDKKLGCKLYFINLTTNHIMTTIPHNTAVCSLWDVSECLRQLHHHPPQATHSTHHLDQLLSLCLKSNGWLSPATALQQAIAEDKPPADVIIAKQQVLSTHAVRCLDNVITTTTDMDAPSERSVRLMLSWLSKCGSLPDRIDQDKVLSLCVFGAGSSQACPVCTGEVKLSDELLSYTCQQGHCWAVCPVSLQLVGSGGYVCAQCDGEVNTVASLQTTEGRWLHKLLTQNTQCLYCTGYYEHL